VSALEAMWWQQQEPPLQRLLLAPLLLPELLFRAGAAVRGALYDRGLLAAARAGAPVLSVGNLAVGGSGKTPAVLELVRRLVARGRRVALLSRGYGARRRDARVVSDGSRLLLGADEAGDEPLLLALRQPPRYERSRAPSLIDPFADQIAAMLDYADASAFTRAFRRWSGTTPARWRAALTQRPQ